MRKIRIGKDIVIRWVLLTNSEKIPLDGSAVSVTVESNTTWTVS